MWSVIYPCHCASVTTVAKHFCLCDCQRFQHLHIKRSHHLSAVLGCSPKLCVVLSGGKNIDRYICTQCLVAPPIRYSMQQVRTETQVSQQHSSCCHPLKAVLKHAYMAEAGLVLNFVKGCLFFFVFLFST